MDAVERVHDHLRFLGGFMDRAISEIDDPLRMTERPRRIV